MKSLASEVRTIEIKGALYGAEAIPAGFAGIAAVTLTKFASGESYTVVRTREDVIVCECPDYVVRHADKLTHCKHCRAALAHGLLDPQPAPAPKPVTSADLKRARYFGLMIPVVPKPAPAPLDLDALVIVITGEPTIISITTTALRPADAREVRSWLDHMAMLAEVPAEDEDGGEWAEWMDVIPIELGPEADPIEGPRPTVDEAFAPTREDEMYRLGFALALEGERMAQAPAGSTALDRVDFRLGQIDGLLALVRRELAEAEFARQRREAEDAALDAWVTLREREEALVGMFETPGSAWPDAELVEARGTMARLGRTA